MSNNSRKTEIEHIGKRGITLIGWMVNAFEINEMKLDVVKFSRSRWNITSSRSSNVPESYQ